MYHEFFGLKRAPFKITPDTRLFFPGGRRGEILDALVYAIGSGEGIIKVVGEVGSGKTMLCRMLEVRLAKDIEIVYLANPSLTPEDILHAIALEMGIAVAPGAGRIHVMQALQARLLEKHAQGRRVVVFIEEAQSMPLETLEEVRLLSNLETEQDKLLQIVLFGQPELDRNLNARSIRQLRERITHSFRLPPLTVEDIQQYVRFRLHAVGYRGPDMFDRSAYAALAKVSQGLTRRVNILADKCLLAAFAENTHNVTRRHVEVAVRDSELRAQRRWRTPALAAATSLAAAGVAVAWVIGDRMVAERAGIESVQVALAPAEAPTGASPQTEAGAAQASSAGAVATEPEARPAAASAPDEVPDEAATERVAAVAPPAAEPPAGEHSPTDGAPDAAEATGARAVEAAAATTTASPGGGQEVVATAAVRVSPEPADARAADPGVSTAGAGTQPAAAGGDTAGAPRSAEADRGETVRAAEPLRVAAAEPAAQPPAAQSDGDGADGDGADGDGADGDGADGDGAAIDRAGMSEAAAAASEHSDRDQAPAAERTPETQSAQSAPPAETVVEAAAASSVEPAVTPGPAAESPSREPVTVAVAPETTVPASSPPKPAVEPAAQAAPEAAPRLLEQRLAAAETWFASPERGVFTIQLLATQASQHRPLEAFLQDWRRRGAIDKVYIYRTRIRGDEWFGVLYDDYATFGEAQAALERLPPELKRYKPFIRNVRDVGGLG